VALLGMTPLLTKREHARVLLAQLMTGRTRIAIADAMTAALAEGISRRTMQRAKADLGLVEIHNGPYGAFWQAP
jgi:ABC-type uncharacterized transport system fused permease/ATPase subunit